MKIARFLPSAALLGCFIHVAFAGTPPERSDKAKPLFDGTTLEGWEALPPQRWAVKDDALTGGDGNKIPCNDFLCTKASYSNFILHLKIKLTGDPKSGMINSGIVEQESETALTVRTITESVIVPKSDIKDRQKLAQSLMPAGMLEALPERKAIELLKFLTSKP